VAFRTIVIRKRCKLDYSLNYFVYRTEDDEKKILLDDINLIIIETLQASITSYLLSNLSDKKIKIIFCDSKHNPQSELVSYYNNYSTFSAISEQIKIKQEIKDSVWKQIIHEKISNELNLLKFCGLDGKDKLEGYLDEIQIGDSTNREGHAAKVYFNSLFGKDFCRDEICPTNEILNYGYAIIVSLINRELKSLGYLTELGIHHIGVTNKFNFSYDIFEPLRSYVDYFVVTKKANINDYKDVFVNLLQSRVFYNKQNMFLNNAISLYVKNVTRVLNDSKEELEFIKYEY